MPIPEAQLERWSHQGAKAQSADTYAAIRNVLDSSKVMYAGRHRDIFLQGSYANDTNIYADSDVDVVIRTGDTFYRDLSRMTDQEQVAYKATYGGTDYTYFSFRKDVLATLQSAFGADVEDGDKAIHIKPRGNRRPADVIPATSYRRYYNFRSLGDENYGEGISLFNKQGEQIVNFPKQHLANCTTKNQETNGRFKPMVRVFKNMRNACVSRAMLAHGIAPSYFLEGLLYNVPTKYFESTFASNVQNSIAWLRVQDRNEFVCANRMYYLHSGDPLVTWKSENCDLFLVAASQYWFGGL